MSMCSSASAEDGKAWGWGKRQCRLFPPHPHSIFSIHSPSFPGSCGRCNTPRLHLPECFVPLTQDFRLFSLLGIVVQVSSWGRMISWVGRDYVRFGAAVVSREPDLLSKSASVQTFPPPRPHRFRALCCPFHCRVGGDVEWYSVEKVCETVGLHGNGDPQGKKEPQRSYFHCVIVVFVRARPCALVWRGSVY